MRFWLSIALCCSPALASSDTPDPRAMHTDDCTRARKQHETCVIDMGKGPEVDGWICILPLPRQHARLIQARHDFIVEILKTTEDL
jgi:hypothetical protein